jgi:release factor glutamine methyltransferase
LHGSGSEPLPQPVSLLVSNPPYTVLADIAENVRRWEPHLALDGGGAHGLAIPSQIMQQAPAYLHPGGLLLMEIGAWQGAAAYQTAQDVFPDARVVVYQDLAGLDRVVGVET